MTNYYCDYLQFRNYYLKLLYLYILKIATDGILKITQSQPAPPAVQDINIEQVLKMFNMVKGCTGYVISNTEGIPLKRSTNITPQKALQQASLVQDLWNVTRKVVVNDLKSPDNALQVIRMRTKHYYEYIISQSPTGQVTLIASQNCVVNLPQKVVQQSKQAPKEQKQDQ